MMVTLNAGGSGDAATTQPGSSFGATARSMGAKGAHPLTQRRRRVGKGTNSGYGGGGGGGGYKSAGGANAADPNSGTQSALSTSTSAPTDPLKGEPSSDMNAGAPASSSSSSGASNTGGNQPQHGGTESTTSTAAPAKPCHSARMSVLCCQSSMRMGARAQLGLCPPGRPRRTLQAALRQRTRASSSSTSLMSSSSHPTQSSATSRRLSVGTSADAAGYYSLERMIGPQSLEDYEDQEEDYLLSTNTFDVESDEEASSGDEDELSSIDALLAPESPGLDDESKYLNLREPLFTPAGVDGSMSNPNGAPMMSGMGSGASGKLPFNRRKIRYFDGITAQDRQAARAYLTQEADKARRRSALLLNRHLRRMQKQERKKRRQQKGEAVDNDSDSENEDPKELALIQGGVAQFDQPMTAAMSAALILESLALHPVESIDGMAKCYDGIVAAGVALLDSQHHDPTSPSDEQDKSKTGRADVLAALAPLLITSLDQPSGDVIVLLARMRRMCGTSRYQRRFVQRVAPCLVRPKNAAMWCLRHQHDMEPIVAACELILDAAHEIFCKGWFEKGQLFLADSKRAETLNSAAAQLRNLSGEPAPDALSLGLTTNHSHGIRRYMSGATAQQKDQTKTNDQLAEWEVMAVDKEIRLTISKIMSSDWNRVTLNTKDSDSVRSLRRTASTSRRPTVLPQSSSGEASPRAMMISPRSPGRPLGAKAPLSPPPPKDYSSSGPPPTDTLFENLMPPPVPADRPTSPDNAFVQKGGAPMVTSPTSAQRQGVPDYDSKPAAIASSTPPRSPKSPMRDVGVEQAPPLTKPAPSPSSQTPFTPLSPRRNKTLTPPSSQNSKDDAKESVLDPFTPALGVSPAAPLSPSSIGTSSTSELVSYRPSSGSSIISTGSGASQSAHYRTLTSTASERKRTVAACRALRAQITRFEDAFVQLHGRPPKGAAERAPLATTYSQYREWKRAIRADAACRIQALFRGARTRWVLSRSDDLRMSRIVRNRAGRRDFVRQAVAPSPRPPAANQENLLNQIGIPVEIGESDPSRTAALKPSASSSVGSLKAPPPGSDPFAGQTANQSLAPQWASQVVRRRAGSGDRTPDGFPATLAPSAHSSPLPSSSPSAPADVIVGSLPELQAKKRELKTKLKQYDMSFARRHGRMPVKAEKEPIRHLYENYNQLKSQITMMEQEGMKHMPAPSVQQLNAPAAAAPPTRILAAPPTPPDSSDSDRSIDSPGLLGASRATRSNRSRSPPVSASSSTTSVPSKDLAALKVEKGTLHLMLRSYEKDFFKEHKRQVSSFADIKPVASQYRRYKEIKKAIAALQSSSDR